MAKQRKTIEDFPAGEPDDTMTDRAMRSAQSRRFIPQPEGEDKGADTPRPRRGRRKAKASLARPDTGSRTAPPRESPEIERGQSISNALLKGAALVPDSSVSGTLRGLLGGASVGMDIDVALERHRMRKREETAANAAMQMEQPVVQPPTPSNVPSDVVATRPLPAAGTGMGMAGRALSRGRRGRRKDQYEQGT